MANGFFLGGIYSFISVFTFVYSPIFVSNLLK